MSMITLERYMLKGAALPDELQKSIFQALAEAWADQYIGQDAKVMLTLTEVKADM